MIRLKEADLQPTERASITDQCLASISRLSNELKDASAYLPAYDQRTYSTVFYKDLPVKIRAMLMGWSAWQAVRSLNENLQETRNAFAPKRKFVFQKKPVGRSNATKSGNGSSEDFSVQSRAAIGTSAKAASSNEHDRHDSGPSEDQDSLDAKPVSGAAAAITITSISSAHYRFESALIQPGSSIAITDIHHSVVDLTDPLSKPFATLAVKSVTESLLLCGRTSGAAHITGVENSTLIIWSRQVRLHECKNCLICLHCHSRPIIEGCKDIRFTPLQSDHVSIPFVALEILSYAF